MAPNYVDNLLTNVHEGLLPPSTNGETILVKGLCRYYHYGCDGFDDRGWGCGYRTLQTLCSWVKEQSNSSVPVPSIPQIQQILVDVEDKPSSFLHSKDWIGSFEICVVIDQLYNIPSKIIHVQQGRQLQDHVSSLKNHFENFASPIMMGGDKDCSSKGIFGLHHSEEKTFLLVVDPHFWGRAQDKTKLHSLGWIKWQSLDEFVDSSFYNLCLPQLKHCT